MHSNSFMEFVLACEKYFILRGEMKTHHKLQRKKISSILVYGGSFDPIHLGHIQAIKLAIHTLSPCHTLITPAFINPFKSSTTYTPKQRVKWLKRALRQNIKNHRVSLLLFEINQHKPTPTIRTLRYIKKIYKVQKLYFLLGADNANHLHTWDEFKELDKICEFVFITRQSHPLPSNFDYKILKLNVPISSTEIRNGGKKEFLPKFLQGLR